jgi:hypothetical protein
MPQPVCGTNLETPMAVHPLNLALYEETKNKTRVLNHILLYMARTEENKPAVKVLIEMYHDGNALLKILERTLIKPSLLSWEGWRLTFKSLWLKLTKKPHKKIRVFGGVLDGTVLRYDPADDIAGLMVLHDIGAKSTYYEIGGMMDNYILQPSLNPNEPYTTYKIMERFHRPKETPLETADTGKEPVPQQGACDAGS